MSGRRPPGRASALAVALGLTACTSAGTPASTPPAPTASTTTSPEPTPTPTPSPSPTPTPTPTPVIGAFDADAALAFAVRLAQMGTRDAGTPGDRAARDVIRAAFEEAGWQVIEEPVPLPQGGTTANLVAVRDPGDLDGAHVVVGGHHDTRGGSPGANDNASGIGALVALASELRDEELGVPVALVAFGAEEYQPSEPAEHHLGSEAYAAQRAADVLGVLVVDMVANGPVTCICLLRDADRTMGQRLQAIVDEGGLIGFQVESRGDLSDHGPFARRGRPAAFLWTYDDGVLHTPADTPDRLQVEDLRRAGDLTLAFLRSLGTPDLEGLRAAP